MERYAPDRSKKDEKRDAEREIPKIETTVALLAKKAVRSSGEEDKAHALIVLGDGNLKYSQERAERALQLSKGGFSESIIIVLGTSREVERISSYLIKAGIEQRKLINGDKSINTLGNVRNAKAILEERGIKDLTLVTHSFQEKRASKIFEYVLGGNYSIKTDTAPQFHLYATIQHFIIGKTDGLMLRLEDKNSILAKSLKKLYDAVDHIRLFVKNQGDKAISLAFRLLLSTKVHEAARKGDLDAAKECAAKDQIFRRTLYLTTPLHDAAWNKSPNSPKILDLYLSALENGAPKVTDRATTYLERLPYMKAAKDYLGLTPWHVVALRSNSDNAQVLRNHDVDAKRRSWIFGLTAENMAFAKLKIKSVFSKSLENEQKTLVIIRESKNDAIAQKA